MKAERLSSVWTPLYQFAVTPLWIGIGALLVTGLVSTGRQEAAAVVGAAFLASSLLFLWVAGRLKRVFLDGDALIVSTGRETLRAPLRDVERVSGTSFTNPELVWVTLRRPAAFGTRFAFIPRGRGYRPFSSHPTVIRLGELILQQQAPGLPPPLAIGESRPGGRVVVLALGVLALALGVAFAASELAPLVRSLNPQEAAVELARQHPALVAALGEPIEDGWPRVSQLNVAGDTGSARFEIPLAGPRGQAELRVQATWRDGAWSYDELHAALDDGRVLDLLE